MSRGGHGQRSVGGGERGRVIEAVADHQHLPALRPQGGNVGDLVGRHHGGMPAVDANRPRGMGDGGGAVAGQDFHREPVAPELRDHIGRVAAQLLDDLRLRFFAPVRHFSHAFFSRLTQLDYARANAFAVLDGGSGELLGVVRLHADSNYESAEYAVLVRSDLKVRGIGWRLMELIIRFARSENLRCIEGYVLQENTTMLDMCRQLGFQIVDDPNDATMNIVRLELR
jgi:RimJ/RimL family protein N-acetyltransferase